MATRKISITRVAHTVLLQIVALTWKLRNSTDIECPLVSGIVLRAEGTVENKTRPQTLTKPKKKPLRQLKIGILCRKTRWCICIPRIAMTSPHFPQWSRVEI